MSYGKSKDDFIDNLKNIRKMWFNENTFLKNIICNRLYDFIGFLYDEFNEETINHIFLVGEETVIYPLKKKEIETLKKNIIFMIICFIMIHITG